MYYLYAYGREKPKQEPTLAEIEEEVLAEGREWMRQRLQGKLQERAERISQTFSPRGPKAGAVSETKADAEQWRRCRRDQDRLRPPFWGREVDMSAAVDLGAWSAPAADAGTATPVVLYGHADWGVWQCGANGG
jgi:hypothetical protein